MRYLIHLLAVFLITSSSLVAQQKVTIYFEYNKSDISSQARLTLDSFIKYRAEISAGGITLGGHCDSRGSNEFNDLLSASRVEVVKSYLLQNGIDEAAIKPSAFGENKPVNGNSNEQEMAMNRRVEIIYELIPPVKINVQTPNNSLEGQIKDTSTKIGGKLVLKNLNFEGGRHVLLPFSIPVLKDLLQTLKNSPTLKIAIEGHVCCAQGAPDGLDTDTRTYNLSVNRAKVIYDYLVENGIEPSRLSWDGYGNRYPIISPEYTESERTINRRVEIKIVQK